MEGSYTMFQDVFDLPYFDREPGDFSCGYFFRFILFVGRFLLLLPFLFGDEMKSLNSEMTNMRSEMSCQVAVMLLEWRVETLLSCRLDSVGKLMLDNDSE